MNVDGSSMKLLWTGPYGWPRYERGLASVPTGPGVYLMTVEYHSGYLIYAAGLTGRSIRRRLLEHSRQYMCGNYNILDISAMQEGRRVEVWHGWGWSPDKRLLFEKWKEGLSLAAQKQLAGFRIFASVLSATERLLERIEASIMKSLDRAPRPLCDIPDRGMMLRPRRPSEEPIKVTNQCSATLHGLPKHIRI